MFAKAKDDQSERMELTKVPMLAFHFDPLSVRKITDTFTIYSLKTSQQKYCWKVTRILPTMSRPPSTPPSLLTQYCVNLEKNHVRQCWPRMSKQTCNLHRISGEEFALTLQFSLVWRHFSFKSVSFWRLLISLKVAFCEGKCN